MKMSKQTCEQNSGPSDKHMLESGKLNLDESKLT